MGAVAKPTPTLTWRPIHGGLGGASRDGLREYHVQPSSIEGWWSVTASAAVATRKLVGSLPGTQQVAEAWESQLVGQGPLSSLRSGQHLPSSLRQHKPPEVKPGAFLRFDTTSYNDRAGKLPPWDEDEAMTKQAMFSESDGYERFMGRWSRRLAPLFLAFAQVGEGCVVLDVGCGTGALACAAADIGSVNVTGVDPCEAYVCSAQERAAGYPVRFDVGDAQALPYPDATFDRALSMLVLNFLAEPVTALREMIRVTRTNGVVAAAVWDYGDGMGMLRTFWDEAVALIPDAASRDERRMPLSRRGELAELWRAQGLGDVQEQPLTIESVFRSFDDYWQPFRAGQGPAGSFTVSLSEPKRQALQSRLRDRLLDGGPDRPFTLPARAWAVRGVVN